MKYFIKTFGCQQNYADSERVARYYTERGYTPAEGYRDADVVVINTCMVREKAEERVYGLARNLEKIKKENPAMKMVVTGCLVGTAMREPTGKVAQKIRRRLSMVDHFLPIEDVGFEYHPVREEKKHGWVPISHGCNNFCTFCIVPYSRGKEISRPFEDIISEIEQMAKEGYTEVTLLGQNVNSYGSDLVKGQKNMDEYELPSGEKVKTTMVKHLGRMRIPTLFPQLLERVAKIGGIEKIMFTSSNPWDFSDDLIQVMADNKNISREIHLPVQSGSTSMLKRMNRWYTREEYIDLVNRIKSAMPEVTLTTDIIVGFPGETDEEFEDTYTLCKDIGFIKAYIARYSPREGTHSEQKMVDDVPYEVKKDRFHRLDGMLHKKKKCNCSCEGGCN